MKKIVMMVMVSLFLVGAASTASAVVLNPGASSSVFSGATPVMSGSPLYTNAYAYSFTGTYPMTGTVTENVYKNTTGMLFTYSITRDDDDVEDAIARLTLTGFKGWQVDADYQAGAGVNPSMVSRSAFGDTIGFDFSTGILSEDTTDLLWIQTNASHYKPSSGYMLDGARADIYGLVGPATPEPATAALLGSGLLGLLGFRRKRMV